MIDRYARKEMLSVWKEENKFKIWFNIESAAMDKMAEMGDIPEEAAAKVREAGKSLTYDISRINEIEGEVKHDVIAFLTFLSEEIGEEASLLHKGMTSSDILDTCFSFQLAVACIILESQVEKILNVLKSLAEEHKYTMCIGRSHRNSC